MIEIFFAGRIPDNIRCKAELIIHGNVLGIGCGWKKISGLKGQLSYRLNRNYRAIAIKNGQVFVSNHDTYIKKIKYLKKAEVKNAAGS